MKVAEEAIEVDNIATCKIHLDRYVNMRGSGNSSMWLKLEDIYLGLGVRGLEGT